jgi:hypothetical protein
MRVADFQIEISAQMGARAGRSSLRNPLGATNSEESENFATRKLLPGRTLGLPIAFVARDRKGTGAGQPNTFGRGKAIRKVLVSIEQSASEGASCKWDRRRKRAEARLPPPDLHPATCSPIESLGRRHQSLRMLTRRRCDARRLTRQMWGVALRRAARTDCGRSAARPHSKKGTRGRAARTRPVRCGLHEGAPRVADRANSPRGPQRRAIHIRPTSGRA